MKLFLKVIGGNAGLSIIPELYFSVGMTGLPFDMASSMSGTGRLLSDWPATTTREDTPIQGGITRPSFGPAGGIGLRFDGGVSKIYYGIGLLNGNENSTVWNPNKKFSVGYKFGVKALGDFTPSNQSDLAYSEHPALTFNMGGVYNTSRDVNGDIDGDGNDDLIAHINYLLTGTLGVAFRYKGFSLTSEGYARRINISSYSAPALAVILSPRYNYTDVGYYVAMGYFVLPKKVELGVQGSQIFRQGPDNNVNQLGGGINWYIWHSHLKLQTSYLWTQDYGDVWGSESNHIHKASIIFSASL